MRRDISHKINRLPVWYYNRTTTGDVLSRVTNDVDTIGQSLNQSVGTLITQIVLFFGSLIMMLITNWIMALTAVAATLIGVVVMVMIMGRSQKYFTRQQRDLGALNGHVEEIYAGHTVVKAYNGEGQAEAEFDHVKFGYEDSDKTVIRAFSAVAKPGQKIAIVGPTGAGKTTMVNLLMRFHEIQDGEIRIDGVSTKNVKREDVHDQFCMVLQDTWLFEGTVRENLVYSTPNVSDEISKGNSKIYHISDKSIITTITFLPLRPLPGTDQNPSRTADPE